MIKNRRRALVAVTAAALALGGVIATAGPALAATDKSGDRACTGTKAPQLVFTATAAGTGQWADNVIVQASPITFNSGPNIKYSPYQNVHWTLHTSGTFNVAPTTSCV